MDKWVIVPDGVDAVEADYEIVQISQADGYDGYGRYYEGSDAGQAVLYMHGIQSHGGWFVDSCRALQEAGMNVLMPERRGCGLNRAEHGDCPGVDELLEDVDCCVQWLKEKTGAKQVAIVAASWSAKLGILYAARWKENVSSLSLVTPGLVAKMNVGLSEKIIMGDHGPAEPERMHTMPFTEARLFTENPAKMQFVENDPLKLMEATARFFVTSTRLDVLVRKTVSTLTVPVYLFLAGRDKIVHNERIEKLLEPALSLIPGIGKKVRVYDEAEHTLDFEEQPEVFYDELIRAVQDTK